MLVAVPTRAWSRGLTGSRACALALQCLGAACVPTVVAEGGTVPEGVSWVAFVPDAPGAQGTALAPYRADEPLVYPVDTARRWWALGYSSEQLEPYELEPARAQIDLLEWAAADACGQLPPPLWSVAATEAEAASGPPAVRAGWSRTCASAPPFQPGGVDVRCPLNPGCGASFTRDGCVVRFDVDACQGREWLAEVQRTGPACWRPAPGCVRVDEGELASARWQCGDCDVETYPVTPTLTLTARAQRVATITATQAPDGVLVPEVQLRQLETGAIGAMGLLGDEVWVATRPPAVAGQRQCGSGDRARHSGEIVRLAQDTLTERGTSRQAGRCVTRLVPDPRGRGMLATYYEADVLYLGLYSPAGQPITQQRLARVTDSDALLREASADVVTSSGTTVVVEYFQRLGKRIDDGVVYVVDTDTLRTVHAEFRTQPIRGVAWGRVGESVLVANTNTLVHLAVPSLAELSLVALPVFSQPLHPQVLDDGRVLVSDPKHAQGVIELSGLLDGRESARVRGVSRVSTYPAIVTDVVVLRGEGDGEGLAMLLTSPDEGRTTFGGVARVSLDTQLGVRVEPQVWRVVRADGTAVASALTQPVLDPRGRLWAAAPWTAEVLRLDVPR